MNEPAHPLALQLVQLLARSPNAPGPVLILGAGTGRSIPPFLDAGFAVDALDDRPEHVAQLRERFAGAGGLRLALASYDKPARLGFGYCGGLATHAYLHGTPVHVGAALDALATVLQPGGVACFTLGSSSDPRFGQGRRIDPSTWAPADGAEAGIPHLYLLEHQARAIVERSLHIVSLQEHQAGRIVGRWAHGQELASEAIVHWFVHARKRPR